MTRTCSRASARCASIFHLPEAYCRPHWLFDLGATHRDPVIDQLLDIHGTQKHLAAIKETQPRRRSGRAFHTAVQALSEFAISQRNSFLISPHVPVPVFGLVH